MAYIAGSAASIDAVLSAIQSACTGSGWTLSGNVLHAGDCYAELVSDHTAAIALRGGTGIDGSNALTGAGPESVTCGSPHPSYPLSWPLDYHLHVFASEVYALIHWGDCWTYLAFGCSPSPGLPGTGNWYTASFGDVQGLWLLWDGDISEGCVNNSGPLNGTGPFWLVSNSGAVNSYVHHGFDGGGWSTAGGDFSQPLDSSARSAAAVGPLLLRQPNAWNGEVVLLPIAPLVTRGGGQCSEMLDIANARYLNIAAMNPTDIIDLSPDHWMVYPFFRKGSQFGGTETDSGYLGWAIRYDGP